MSKSKTVSHGVGCSLPTLLLISLILYVLQLTVAPAIPTWLVLTPLVIAAAGFVLTLLIIGVCLVLGAIGWYLNNNP